MNARVYADGERSKTMGTPGKGRSVDEEGRRKERIMHNSVIKYVRVSRIERYPSKRAARRRRRRLDLLGNKVL